MKHKPHEGKYEIDIPPFWHTAIKDLRREFDDSGKAGDVTIVLQGEEGGRVFDAIAAHIYEDMGLAQFVRPRMLRCPECQHARVEMHEVMMSARELGVVGPSNPDPDRPALVSFRVYCPLCDYWGPVGNSEEEATKEWNGLPRDEIGDLTEYFLGREWNCNRCACWQYGIACFPDCDLERRPKQSYDEEEQDE